MRNINELPECPVATTISLVGSTVSYTHLTLPTILRV